MLKVDCFLLCGELESEEEEEEEESPAIVPEKEGGNYPPPHAHPQCIIMSYSSHRDRVATFCLIHIQI